MSNAVAAVVLYANPDGLYDAHNNLWFVDIPVVIAPARDMVIKPRIRRGMRKRMLVDVSFPIFLFPQLGKKGVLMKGKDGRVGGGCELMDLVDG